MFSFSKDFNAMNDNTHPCGQKSSSHTQGSTKMSKGLVITYDHFNLLTGVSVGIYGQTYI